MAPGQEDDSDKVKLAKRILDENLAYLSKECYMRLNIDVVQNKNPETIRVLLAFTNHHSVDLLIRNCMLLFNEHEYNRLVNKHNSPVKTTPLKGRGSSRGSSNEKKIGLNKNGSGKNIAIKPYNDINSKSVQRPKTAKDEFGGGSSHISSTQKRAKVSSKGRDKNYEPVMPVS